MFFFFALLFFGVVAITVGSIVPLLSIASTTESVSESGIKLRGAVQDSEVRVWDDEVDDDGDEYDDDLFTIRNNQPTSVLRYIMKTEKSNETTGSYGDDYDETFFMRSICQQKWVDHVLNHMCWWYKLQLKRSWYGFYDSYRKVSPCVMYSHECH